MLALTAVQMHDLLRNDKETHRACASTPWWLELQFVVCGAVRAPMDGVRAITRWTLCSVSLVLFSVLTL